jgi:hypothetical protein
LGFFYERARILPLSIRMERFSSRTSIDTRSDSHSNKAIKQHRSDLSKEKGSLGNSFVWTTKKEDSNRLADRINGWKRSLEP